MKQTYTSCTQKVYHTQKESFLAFCSVMGYTPVPSSTLVLCRFAIILRKHLCRNDFVFHYWGVMINIRWSKMIQFKDRTLYIPMPRISGHPLCSVQAICHAFKFSAGACPGGPAFLRSQNQPLTPAHFVTRIRSCLDGNGVDVRQVAAHSFRREAASWAYSVGLPIDTIRLIGDWKSQAYTAYVGSSTTLLQSAIKSMIYKILI